MATAISDKELDAIKSLYPAGHLVRLVKQSKQVLMPYAKPGDIGRVKRVDEKGNICVLWQSGVLVDMENGKDECIPIELVISTAYSKETDMTFILEDEYSLNDLKRERVVGFYYGEPNEECTREFYGKLEAVMRE